MSEYPREVLEIVRCLDEVRHISDELWDSDWFKIAESRGLIEDVGQIDPDTGARLGVLYELTGKGLDVLRTRQAQPFDWKKLKEATTRGAASI